MENYSRVPDSIRRNENLTSTEKLFMGYLYTYQNKVVGKKIVPTGTYCFDKQTNLAYELGVNLKTITNTISSLEEKGLIFKAKKGKIDGKSQYKNRKAIIMVDDNNPLPTKEDVKVESKVVEKPIQEPLPTVEVVTPEVQDSVSKFDLKEIVNEAVKRGTISIVQADSAISLINSDGLVCISTKEKLMEYINDYNIENKEERTA